MTQTLRLDKFGKVDLFSFCDAEEIKDFVIPAAKYKSVKNGTTPDRKPQFQVLPSSADDQTLNVYPDKIKNENPSLFNALQFNNASSSDLGTASWNDVRAGYSAKYRVYLITGIGEVSSGGKSPVVMNFVKQ